MKDFVLEVCVDSIESAIAAWKGGAIRLELCSDLIVGGITPSIELFRMVKEEVPLPVHVLIRPRFGDFLYTDWEYNLMCRQIRSFVNAGADALVIGSLKADGTLHGEQMEGMMEHAAGRKITLHRAFDVTRDAIEAFETARSLGVDTILTSGQEKDCYTGKECLCKLLQISKETRQPDILIGGGVNAEVISKLCAEMPAECPKSFHMSGKEVLPSNMEYRNSKVSMGLPGISEFEIYRTSECAVRAAAEVLRKNIF